MPNQVTIKYVIGGFVITKIADGVTTVEVVTSVGKLNKALRLVTEELSLLPKKSEENDE